MICQYSFLSEMDSLHWADYLIFVVFLAISIGIGAFHAMTGGRQRTVAEFIMANRNLKMLPASLSLSMTVISSSSLIAYTGEAYGYGILSVVWSCITYTIVAFLIQQVVVVWLYPMKLTSVFEVRYRQRT